MSLMLRSVVLTGVATTCVIAGPALAPAAAGGAASLLSAVAGVGAAVLGELAYNGLCSSYDNVAKRLRDAAENGKLPENHDLIRAIRLSQLSGAIYVATTLLEEIQQNPDDYPTHLKPFCEAVVRWAEDETDNAKNNQFDLVMKNDDWRGVMSLAKPPDDEEESTHDFKTQLSDLGEAAATAFFEELEAALHKRNADFIPEEFSAHFHGMTAANSWIQATQLYFAEKVKSDAKVRAVVFLEGLEAVQRGISAIAADVRGVTGLLGERFDALEERIEALAERLEIRNTEYLDRCIAELHEAILSDQIVDALFNKLVMSMPRGTRWMQPAAQTQQRIDELTEFFVGRADDFQNLDDIVDGVTGADRGLWVVTAPAGSGKSALLAKWVERRQRSGDLVARHFISHQFDRTTSKEAISGHLLSQIQQMNEFAEAVTPETAPAQQDQIFDQLGRSAQAKKKRIVVLDGLDEADSLIDPFVEAGYLAEGVYVIVSARAAADTTPLYVEKWLARLGGDVPGARICLDGLGSKSIEIWLEDFIAHLNETEVSELSSRIRDVTDGLPLFVRFVVEDLSAAMPKLSDQAERLKLIQGLPAPFPKYVRKQIENMSEGPDSVWQGAIPFMMALLSRSFGAMNFGELRDIPQLKELPQETRTLPHSITRWLSIRGSKIGFQHPRLAEAFSHAIGDLDEVEVLSDYVLDAEDIFIEWMKMAWRPRASRRGDVAGWTYALDWLPHHLERLNDNAYSDCVSILTNVDFILTRLSDSKAAVARLARHIDMWFRLPSSIRKADSNSTWDAFWIENEAVLILASETPLLSEQPLHQVIQNCLGDAGVASVKSLSALAKLPAPSALMRAHRRVHSASVSGVQVLEGGRVVSYGDDGGVLFWDASGAREAGGDAAAHRGWVRGVQVLDGGRVVSYGGDGGVLFWDASGAREAGGDAAAHSASVSGVRVLEGGRVVSYGHDGGVLFWGASGAREAGGDAAAHTDLVRGVKMLEGGRLVSYGHDGGVLFWDASGAREAGGDAAAHSRPVSGVQVLEGGRVVSYGDDGGVLFWDASGAREAGGDAAAHSSWASGVQVLEGGRVVSYGGDGGVLFWDASGAREAGGDAAAHSDRVLGVSVLEGGRVVSYGHDGGVLFWDASGARSSGGDAAAHSASVSGVQVLEGGRVVSYGDDGGVLFWDASGAREVGGDATAHSRPVSGVQVLYGGRVVSYGRDGGVLFWDASSVREAGGDPAAHSRRVSGVQVLDGGRVVSCGHDGGVLFWDASGAREAGGDAAAHSDWVLGVQVFDGGRVVSYGRDGGVLFWDASGEREAGGDAAAHSDWVRGVKMLEGGRVVSYDRDGGVLFWDASGAREAGGDAAAHSDWVLGVQVLDGGRVVSYGRDGGVLFWDASGAREAGGDAAAHSDWVLGVQVLDGGRVVSYGRDGGVLFWDASGAREAGGDAAAHSDWVLGVQVLDGGRVVSYGRDGGVLFWDASGEREAGGDAAAHSDWVRGVKMLEGGRVVSYDRDGGVLFWDASGAREAGGDAAAHSDWVLGVQVLDGGRVVSYGRDGGVLFWDASGEREAGGDAAAHSDWVRGVKMLEGGRVVSYGYDGGVLFWDASGAREAGGDAAAHSDWVRGVKMLEGGRVVSYGYDGGVLFWDATGRRKVGGDAAAHSSVVVGVEVLECGRVVSWSKYWLCFWDAKGHFKGLVVPPGGIRRVLLSKDRLVVVSRSIRMYPLKDGLPF